MTELPPLDGLVVLDFSTLLPGPMATLILAEAGAEVIKIERPDGGDPMRAYDPPVAAGADGVNFALLNRGKRSVAIDLKAAGAVDRLMPLLRRADVLVEQFRPGVMDRLGLGHEAVAAVNPGLIYCAITGYGQTGPWMKVAGHDLNYVAEAGMLGLSTGADGAPIPPPALLADIAAGAYPAVMNILLALEARRRSGRGAYLDIAMADNVFPFLYWAMGARAVTGKDPVPGGELVTGGSPRYAVYRTADDRFVAAAPLEDKFWAGFCAIIGLEESLRDDARDPAATRAGVAVRIASESAAAWRAAFAGRDVCAVVVATLAEAMDHPQFRARGLFDRTVDGAGRRLTALPVPVVPGFRVPDEARSWPALGADDAVLDGTAPDGTAPDGTAPDGTAPDGTE